MKPLLLSVMMFGLVVPALAETPVEKFYDRKGNYRGQVTLDGSRYIVRDQNGNFQSFYKQEGDRVVHYDKNGNRLGSSEIVK